MKKIVIKRINGRFPEYRIYDRSKIQKTTINSIAGGSCDKAGSCETELGRV